MPKIINKLTAKLVGGKSLPNEIHYSLLIVLFFFTVKKDECLVNFFPSWKVVQSQTALKANPADFTYYHDGWIHRLLELFPMLHFDTSVLKKLWLIKYMFCTRITYHLRTLQVYFNMQLEVEEALPFLRNVEHTEISKHN